MDNLRKRLLIVITGLMITITALCQSESISEIIKTTAEELASDETGESTLNSYIELLHELAEDPVMVNTGSEDEISRLFFLTAFQVKALADYVRSSGKIVSQFEIALIPGFDKETAAMVYPFISLRETRFPADDSSRFSSKILTTISLKAGQNDTSLAGNSLRVLTKYRFTAGNLSGGFTFEKDPGEQFLNGSPPMPDFSSFNIAYIGKGILKKFIIGDFSARFGQGTIINTTIPVGLSVSSPGYLSPKNEIRPYTSADENNFFRGAAAELAWRSLGLILFYSDKDIDAALTPSSDSLPAAAVTIYNTGIHSKGSLLTRKDRLRERSLGLNISGNFRNIRIGMAFTADRTSNPLLPSNSGPEGVYDQRGNGWNYASLYYSATTGRMILHGELSTESGGKFAFIQGVSMKPSDRVSVNYLYTRYTSGFSSLRGRGTGTASSSGNDWQMLGSFTIEAAKHLFVSGGCDLHQWQWLRYRNSAPSATFRRELRAKYQPYENLSIDISYGVRLNTYNKSEEKGIPSIAGISTRNIKGSARYIVSERITIAASVQYTSVRPSGSRGAAIIPDITWRPSGLPLRIWVRYCLFNTDDWDSRIYSWENDLLHSFSIPVLYGDGSRSFIMAEWNLFRTAFLRIKYSCSESGREGISLPRTDEIKIQYRMIF